jgi:hypothetical protein
LLLVVDLVYDEIGIGDDEVLDLDPELEWCLCGVGLI